jgi:hypothetical protein
LVSKDCQALPVISKDSLALPVISNIVITIAKTTVLSIQWQIIMMMMSQGKPHPLLFTPSGE